MLQTVTLKSPEMTIVLTLTSVKRYATVYTPTHCRSVTQIGQLSFARQAIALALLASSGYDRRGNTSYVNGCTVSDLVSITDRPD